MKNKIEYSITWVCLQQKYFAKAGLDNVTSAMYKYQQRFGLDVQFSALVLQ
jgi:hypothetical protein